MFLDSNTFTTVIGNAPLVSIDFVVHNSEDKVLLGLRRNRPAQNYWFVPGGRILKNESLADAFLRLTEDELGLAIAINKAELLGPYDHFYNDCVFGEHISTHYVAIAYRLKLNDLVCLPEQQHFDYQWLRVDELLASEQVHENTKAYFLSKEWI